MIPIDRGCYALMESFSILAYRVKSTEKQKCKNKSYELWKIQLSKLDRLHNGRHTSCKTRIRKIPLHYLIIKCTVTFSKLEVYSINVNTYIERITHYKPNLTYI